MTLSTDSIQSLFAQGLQLHSQGEINQAMAAYEQVLKLDPQHADTLYHVGIAAFQVGNFEMAAQFFRSAIAVRPDDAAAHSNLGNALKELRQLEDALSSYDQALALQDGDADTHFNRAGTLLALQRYADALHSYDQVLAINPADEQAWQHRALILQQQSQLAPALYSVEQALLLNPQNPETLSLRGDLLLSLGRLDEAEQCYRTVLEWVPDIADAHYQLGRLLLLRERYEDALACFKDTLSRQPSPAIVQELRGGLITAYGKLARSHLDQNRPEVAAQLFDALLKIDHSDVENWELHALALHEAGHNEAALASIDRALSFKPNEGRYHLARGLMLLALQRYDGAQQAFEQAIRSAPRLADAYAGLGRLQARTGQFERALKNYKQAIAIDPNCSVAQWNQAQIYLRRGDFKQGWRAYEWRWKTPSLPMYKSRRDFPQPAWTGSEALAGKTILLHAEQGLGDTLQFCRYATLVAQRGARVVLEVPAPLVTLMQSLAGVAHIVRRGEPLPPFDYHLPLMSLPLAFDTRLDSIPAPSAYLAADPAKVAQWQERLAAPGQARKPRIGVAWRGAAHYGNDQSRSLPLPAFAKLLSDQYEFISLQKEVPPDEQALLDSLPVRQLAEHLHDFSDTAALCAQLDLVITVDTSVAHLAGALGKPVWILLPEPGEWRWLEQRSDSPWYASARLFRQPQAGDWSAVIEQLAGGLKALPFAGLSG
jgi:tetratricopeptide (TPR) repeat protein